MKVDYLVCKDICIPILEKKKINLNLRILRIQVILINFIIQYPKKRKKFSIIKKENIDKNSLKLEIKPN